MTAAPEPVEEIEELDIVEELEGVFRRLVLLELAITGAVGDRDYRAAFDSLLADLRADVEDLSHRLKTQDAAKRASGAPRAERIFIKGEGEP